MCDYKKGEGRFSGHSLLSSLPTIRSETERHKGFVPTHIVTVLLGFSHPTKTANVDLFNHIAVQFKCDA